MKRSFVIFTAIFFSQIIHAQTIRVTNPKPLILEKINGYNQVQNYMQTVSFILNDIDTIFDLDINLDTSDFKSKISYSNSTLVKFRKVIKIELFFTACCTSIETHYFLCDFKGKIFQFPPVHNTLCDGIYPIYDIIFPEDFHGQKNMIYLGQINYQKDNSKMSVMKICDVPIEFFQEIKLKRGK